jgi:hypothetical protein
MAQTADRQMLSRRNILTGLAVTLAAPAIVHAGNLMPIRAIVRSPPLELWNWNPVIGEFEIRRLSDFAAYWDAFAAAGALDVC